MIAKGKSISHLGASIHYALRREEAIILDKNIVAETPHEVAKEFRLFQMLNHRCERNSLSFVISPTIEDGKKLSDENLEKINRSFLEKLKLDNHQYIAFVHKNTEHKHIHLYVNRIDYTGKAYNDQFISNRSAHVAEHIAKEMGLSTAKEIQQIRYKERQVAYPEIEPIKKLSKAILGQQGVNSINNFVRLFNAAGAEAGFRAEAYTNKQGAFQGLRFYAGEHKFKASEIDRSLSKKNLEYSLEKQLVKGTDTEFVLNHIKETQQGNQKLENILYKSERIVAETSELFNALLSANPYQTEPQMNQEPDAEEERQKELKKKRPFAIRRF